MHRLDVGNSAHLITVYNHTTAVLFSQKPPTLTALLSSAPITLRRLRASQLYSHAANQPQPRLLGLTAPCYRLRKCAN